MISALIRRYKLFFAVFLVIIVVQVFLAYKSIKIPLNLRAGTSNEEAAEKKEPLPADDGANDSEHSILSTLQFTPKCDFTSDKEVLSAVQRSHSQPCKEFIVNVACAIKSDTFYPKRLPNTCPSGNYIANRALGCFKDDRKNRVLPGMFTNFKETNSPKKCIQMCLQSGFLLAGVEYSTECFCGNQEPSVEAKLPDSSCNMKCPSEPKSACGGYYTMNVYETGIAKYSQQSAESQVTKNKRKIRVVFLLTLNGRAVRQVYRLLKSLYSVDHFYYIHIDSRQDYLYRELLPLESSFPNIRLTRKRFSTIWGGASLLEMLLSCMSELLATDWSWDFVLNLSESDFPIKTIDKLEAFLSANSDKNFVKSHGREAHRFIQKQGLDKTFVECDTHMWRIGDRDLPSGIQIDGGSDWICLSRKFVSFVALENRKDELLKGLITIFRHTLLPAESFFHTAIRNSVFCDTYIDNNLHITNWKRKMGCKCQYKSIVDWCGCSPNDFKPDDWPRLVGTEHKQLFFGRKFEPAVNQIVVLQLEEWLFGSYPVGFENLNSYWQNSYHHKDSSPAPNEAMLTVARALIRINSKSNPIQQFYEPIKVLEVTDYWELDMYKGFLIKHDARINSNVTVELETWCRPSYHHAQVSKSIKLAKKIMQLDVSSDFDKKELMSRNFAKVLSVHSEPVLILKLSGTSHPENSTLTLTVLWIDPADKVQESAELNIEDVTVTSINHIKANVHRPMESGTWKVKVLHKKSLIGVTKFLVIPPATAETKENDLEQLIANFYLVKETCISLNQKSVRDIVKSYLGTGGSEDGVNVNNVHRFPECKRSMWSSMSPDPKSELITDGDGSS